MSRSGIEAQEGDRRIRGAGYSETGSGGAAYAGSARPDADNGVATGVGSDRLGAAGVGRDRPGADPAGSARSGETPPREAPSAGTSPVSAPALELEHLCFCYPEASTPVLRDVTLSLPEGAFALVVGATGSGKSTLLSLVKPEISPAGERAGTVRVFGRELAELDARELVQTIGYVFQSPENQIVCESVWHEMAFCLENLGTPQDEMRRLVAETSYFFGMEDWFRHDTAKLSGGRKQLLALASTLVAQPRLLLLDEPTAQLDPIAEKNFLHALFRINRELGCTVVVATHSPRAMVDYATCAFELHDGALHEVRSLEALRARPSLGVDGGREDAACRPSRADGRDAQGAPAAPEGGRDTQDAPAAVELERAWFRYERDGAWVLRGLDLRVMAGGIHALVGGNGCGKSTLLGVIAGIHKLQRGRLRTLRGTKTLLPQDPKALFAAETALDELLEWRGIGGYGPDGAREMLARLGLAGCEGRHPYDLSGGQQQLLALGKVLLVQPRLLLLDEPTKGLDAAARRVLARTLRELRAQGVTVLVATHDLDFVQQLADEVSMLFDGEMACTQPAEEFFERNVYYRP